MTPPQSTLHDAGAADASESIAQAARPGPGAAPPEAARHPLSPSQQVVWFAERLAPGHGGQTLSRAMRLLGEIDGAVLARALATLGARHLPLRMGFGDEAGNPYQAEQPAARPRLVLQTVAGDSAEKRERALAVALAQALGEPFELATAPLVRATLFALGPREHVLLLTGHRIVADEHSIDLLLGELRGLYASGGADPHTDAPASPYLGLVDSQLRQLEHPAVQRQLDWWRDTLRGLPPLRVPTDRSRGRDAPGATSWHGEIERFEIDPGLAEALRALARREHATLFAVLAAAFQVLMMRYSGQRDFALGIPASGRRRMDAADAIGCFAHPVVLRADLSGEPSFRQLLARVRAQTADALANQDVPFERLVAAIGPRRSAAAHPFFQVGFALRPAGGAPWQLDGLAGRPIALHDGAAPLELSLAIEDTAQGLTGEFEYRTALYDAQTIRRMSAHFTRLLEGLVADPDACIDEATLLSETERRCVLERWNATDRDYAPPHTLDALVADTLRRHPDAPAIEQAGQPLTGRQLAAEANRLAHRLAAAGVGPGATVALCVARSPAMAVAMLAIVRTGAACVPLDPTLPPERLAALVGDAAPAALVTDCANRKTMSALPTPPTAGDGGRVLVVLDEQAEADALARLPDTAPIVAPATPEAPAFVHYVADPAGRPRGVPITHQALCNSLQWLVEYLRITPMDRWLQASPPGTIAALLELFAPLVAGAPAVLAPPEVGQALAPDGQQAEALARAVRAQGATLLQLTPARLRAQLQASAFDAGDDAPLRLRHVLCQGEPLERGLAAACMARLPGVTLGNLFGAAECGGPVSAFDLRAVPEGSGTVPIGRPIANQRCLVVDARGQPAPIGVPGELCVGGIGVMRGYWNRPEAGLECLFDDPFGDHGRLVRTGDRVRWLADGVLEHLGRVDRQLPLAGQRAEPGEVEAVLGAHPAVAQCAVLQREDPPRGARLVAYVAGDGLDQRSLRGWMAERLPAHMLPSAVIRLATLPLLDDGRLDRRGLPAFETALATQGHPSPRTPAAELLAQIWCDLLGLEQVDDHDDFFESGGHSLLVPRLAARIRETFGRELPLRAIFEQPRLARLAERIEGADEGLPPIARAPLDGKPQPLSAAQQGLWMLDRLRGRGETFNLVRTLKLYGELDIGLLGNCLNELKMRHAGLRTAIQVHGDLPCQVVHPNVPFSLPVTAIGAATPEVREAEVRQAIEDAARLPFDLARAPLLRARLLRLGREEHVLLLIAHRIVADDWSMRVLARELDTLYTTLDAARRDGELRTDPLPAQPPQYVDFARWQAGLVDTPTFQRQLDWWHTHLAGLRPLALPADRPRPPRPERDRGTVSIDIGAAKLKVLQRLARAHTMTPAMVLLAAFEVALWRFTGQEDLAVGILSMGRSHPELHGLFGNCVNLLVLRNDLSGDPGFAQLMARVREGVLAAHAHGAVPFERLVASLPNRRDGRPNPLVDVSFAFGQPAEVRRLQLGVRSIDAPLRDSLAPTDLALAYEVRGDGLRGTLEYDADLFDPATAERLAHYIGRVIDSLAADPTQPLSLLTGAPPLPLREAAAAGTRAMPALPGSPAPRHDAIPATTPLPPGPSCERLIDVWREVLGVADIGADDDFFALGGHSLRAVRLQGEIERRFGRSLPLPRLFAASTPRAQAVLLDDPDAALADGGRLVTLRGGDARPGLFVVPDPDDTPLGLTRLAKATDGTRALYVLEARDPGTLHGSEPPIDRLAERLLTQIRYVQPHGPYRIVGLGHGGLLAYEIGRRLRETTDTVSLLALVDCQRPAPPAAPGLRERLRNGLRTFLGGRPRPPSGQGPLPPPAWRGYEPRPFAGRLAVVRPTLVEDPDRPTPDPSMGWAPLAGEGVDSHDFASAPGRMLDANHAGALGGLIERLLGDSTIAVPPAAGGESATRPGHGPQGGTHAGRGVPPSPATGVADRREIA